MRTAVIFHGTKGSPKENWFPWLATELRQRGIAVAVPKFPTPRGQSLDRWMKVFRESVPPPNEETILVGHSLGATFILRLLERMENPVALTVLVAGLTDPIGIPAFDSVNRSFITDPYDWESIRRNAGTALCISGDGDPYVPARQAEEMAKHLKTRLTVVPNAGHLNAESGFETFPLLLEAIAAHL